MSVGQTWSNQAIPVARERMVLFFTDLFNGKHFKEYIIKEGRLCLDIHVAFGNQYLFKGKKAQAMVLDILKNTFGVNAIIVRERLNKGYKIWSPIPQINVIKDREVEIIRMECD